jgi:hypothetical protein
LATEKELVQVGRANRNSRSGTDASHISTPHYSLNEHEAKDAIQNPEHLLSNKTINFYRNHLHQVTSFFSTKRTQITGTYTPRR